MDQPAQLLDYQNFIQSRDSSAITKRAAAVHKYKLLANTGMIEIDGDIPVEVWSNTLNYNDEHQVWKHMLKNYEGVQTRGMYEQLILRDDTPDPVWELGLFGHKHNALMPVFRLAVVICHYDKDNAGYKLLKHVVTMVCLQYYLIQRNRFYVVKADKSKPFYDIHQPYIFMFHHRYDVKKNTYRIPAHEMKAENMARIACTYDFVSFVVAVLRHTLPICDRLAPAWLSKSVFNLCDRKISQGVSANLFNNCGLVLLTSRFSHLRIDRFADKVIESISKGVNVHTLRTEGKNRKPFIEEVLIKFFMAPNAIKYPRTRFPPKPPYNNKENQADVPTSSGNQLSRYQALVPDLYCHFDYSYSKPMFTFSHCKAVEQQPESLWELHEPDDHILHSRLRWQDMTLETVIPYVDSTLHEACITVLNLAFREVRMQRVASQVEHHDGPKEEEEDAVGVKKKRRVGHAAMVSQNKRPRLVKKEVEEEAQEHKVQQEREQGAHVVGKVREVVYSVPRMDAVRVAYSYVIADRKGIANGVKSSIRARPFHAETSPYYISQQAFEWMMSRPYDVLYTPLRSHGPVMQQEDEEDEEYDAFQWPPIHGMHKLKWKLRIRKSLRVVWSSAEHYCVACYLRNKLDAGAPKLGEVHVNFYVMFYALVVLLRSEENAMLQLREDVLEWTHKSDEAQQWTQSVYSSTTPILLLVQIRSSYSLLLATVNSRMREIESENASLAALFNAAQRKFRAESGNTASIPTEQEWQAGMQASVYRNMVREASQVPCTLSSSSPSSSEVLVDALCAYWAGETGAQHTLERYKDVQVTLRGRALSLAAYANFLYTNVYFCSIILSFAWRLVIPANVIPPPQPSSSQDLNDMRRHAPISYRLLCHVMKIIRGNDYKQELQKFISYHSDKPINDLSKTVFNAVQFLYTYVRKILVVPKAGQDEDETGKLLQQVTHQTRPGSVEYSNGSMEYIEMHRQHAMAQCVHFMNGRMALFGAGAFEEDAIKFLCDTLSPVFAPLDLPARIVDVLSQLDKAHRTLVDAFRDAALESHYANEKARKNALALQPRHDAHQHMRLRLGGEFSRRTGARPIMPQQVTLLPAAPVRLPTPDAARSLAVQRATELAQRLTQQHKHKTTMRA